MLFLKNSTYMKNHIALKIHLFNHKFIVVFHTCITSLYSDIQHLKLNSCIQLVMDSGNKKFGIPPLV